MRDIIIVIIAFAFVSHRNVLSVMVDRNGEAYPVYAASKNDSFEERRNISYSHGEGLPDELGGMMNAETNFSRETNQSFIDYSNVTAGLLMAQYERCLQSKGFLDCLKFKTFKFLKDLFEPITDDNVSDVIRSRAMIGVNEPVLIRLPPPNGKTQPILVNMMNRAFGSSASIKTLQFVIEQMDDYLSRHGVMITVKNVQGDEPVQLDSPWLIDVEHNRERRSVASTGRKVKKKEYAIVFPMLVLFKFLKIKMLLVPILLGVVFLKKLLILTLTLLPYLIGLFGCCRRPPGLGGIQTAGFLQELDTRGEFSSNLGYAFPYRDFAVRTREKLRPSEAYNDY